MKAIATPNPRSFRRTEKQLAAWAKALAHPARVAILRFLAKQDRCFCGDIVDHLPLAQSTVSQHLRELREAGLVRGTVDGVKVCYCIDARAVAKARAAFDKLFDAVATAETCNAAEC